MDPFNSATFRFGNCSNGYEKTAQKRDPETASIPIIMLTAKGEAIDRIVGLELGADDYITKPFIVNSKNK